ncbi:MAG: hypothetical protein K2P58_11275 [Hyphomonadaceae bacterium]|nr:hypothetical protein [Hyphomonadaceae bacterium]
MHLDAPAISHHRLKRFHRWAMLWLRWFAAFLDAACTFAPLSRQAQRIAHGWLDFIETLITNIVLIRAAKRVRPLLRRHFGPQRLLYPKRRAILGLRLRRALHQRDLRARIAALSQSIEDLIDRVARRLPRGLTRRCGGLSRTHARASSARRAELCMGICRQTADTS